MKLYIPNLWITSSNIYKNCEELPLWNFQKYLETNELKYFTKNLKEVKGLDSVMSDIFSEYVELSGNNAIISRFHKIHKLLKLQGKFSCVMIILKSLYNYSDKNINQFDSLIIELQKWGYKIDKNKDIFEQIENIGNRIQNIKTQIEVLGIELKKEDKKESQSIEKQLILVGKVLELRYKLDSKEISLKEWIELNKLANEQSNRLNSK